MSSDVNGAWSNPCSAQTGSVYSDPWEWKNLTPVAWDRNSCIFAISHLFATPEQTVPCGACQVHLQPDTLAIKHLLCVTIEVAEPTPCAPGKRQWQTFWKETGGKLHPANPSSGKEETGKTTGWGPKVSHHGHMLQGFSPSPLHQTLSEPLSCGAWGDSLFRL